MGPSIRGGEPFDHFVNSLARRLENSSGLLPIGSAPSCAMRARTSGVLIICTISPLILDTMSKEDSDATVPG